MIPSRLPIPLRGIVPPMVTPLLGPDTLDVAGLERLVEHMLAGGVHGLFILGTTGEGPALSYALRRELIQRTCALVAGRVPVLVCVTDTSVTESLHMVEHAAKAGADAAVFATPYYFHMSQSDLLRLVEQMTGQGALPLFLYNMPHLTKLAWEPETLAVASKMPNVVGLKDSSGDLQYLRRAIAAVQHRATFTVLLGPEQLLLEGLGEGVHGSVCGGANLFPALYVGLFDAFTRGDMDQARTLQERVIEMNASLYHAGDTQSSYLRGLKAALELSGICSGQMTRPFAQISAEQKERVRQRLTAYAHLLREGSGRTY